MSLQKTCSTCRYSKASKDGSDNDIIECHRGPPTWVLFMKPPTVVGQQGQILKQTGWPMVQPTQDCGEWDAMPKVLPL